MTIFIFKRIDKLEVPGCNLHELARAAFFPAENERRGVQLVLRDFFSNPRIRM